MAEASLDCIAVLEWIWTLVKRQKRPFISHEDAAVVEWKYDVYLSCGGPDTRKGVTFELHDQLQMKGLKTFKDDRDLEAGDPVPPALTEAIRESRFAIVVLSRDYASSTWRLEELTAICECMKDQNRILPVLYHVKPSDVRLPNRSSGEAFSDQHETSGQQGSEKMQRWSEVLEMVVSLSRWKTEDYKTHKELVEVTVEFLRSKVLPDATGSAEDFEESEEPIRAVDDEVVRELPIVSSASQWKHDVFLSFRGLETRKGIASYLSHKLKRKGIRTFMDEEGLKVGDLISSNLLTAINESRSAIVILSPKYASSTWCLDELVSIVQGWKTRNTLVYPVFYNVEPHDVRDQTGSFEEIFTRRGKRKHREKVLDQWKAALTTVASLTGIESKFYRSDRQLVEKIVQDVCGQVRVLESRALAESIVQDEISALLSYLVGVGGSIRERTFAYVNSFSNRITLCGVNSSQSF